MPLRELKAKVRKGLPRPAQNLLLARKAATDLFRADIRECNVCGYRGRFWPYGDPPRKGAVCGQCGLKERHRLIGLWLDANDIRGARVLHFAPEPELARQFRSRTNDYKAADLNPKKADIVLNIEAIDLPDASVDLIVCLHVLEHVNDAKALREMHRILTPGGRAVLMFPIVEGWDTTYENPEITAPEDRALYFGQWDHVRLFGRDVRGRIADAGFSLTEFTAKEPEVTRFGLWRGEKIFVATKPG